jgi:hypothetical protein
MVRMRPYRVSLTSEKEIGVKLVRLDRYVSIDDVLLFYVVTTTEWDRLRGLPRLDWLEDVRRDGL